MCTAIAKLMKVPSLAFLNIEARWGILFVAAVWALFLFLVFDSAVMKQNSVYLLWKTENIDSFNFVHVWRFIDHVTRRDKLEHLVTNRMMEGLRSRKKRRRKMSDGLTEW